MKKIVCVFACVVFWNCGGDGFRITDEHDVKNNSSTEKNIGNYPGFSERIQKPKGDDDFYDGFFDRHREDVNHVSYDFDSEYTDDNGSVSIEKTSIAAYVNYGGTPSQVFALYDKYNEVNIHVSWNPNENYANREDLKFFLCDVDHGEEYKPIEGLEYDPVNGLNCSLESSMCSIDQSAWIKGEKDVILKVNLNNYNKNIRVGLCMQYATYLPVLYDALEIKAYPKQLFDVTLTSVGTIDVNLKQKIEDRIKETLGRAGVEINLKEGLEYKIPDVFENKEYRKRKLSKDYLYVAVDHESSCYDKIGDDLLWLKSKLESDIGNGNDNIERRVAMILNLPTVKFWTIDEFYRPCTRNLKDLPDEKSNFGYIVGILNNEKYEECQQNYPESENVYYEYDHFDYKMHWRNKYGELIDDNISSYIDPRCHVLVDLNRLGNRNGSDSRYYRTLMPSNSLGRTKPAKAVGGKTGLMAFIPPNDEIVFVHELTHLCGLSDIENSQNNLMYQSKKNGTFLGNIPLKANLSDKDKTGSGVEQQWDCLHDEKNADGCLDKAYRLLNF